MWRPQAGVLIERLYQLGGSYALLRLPCPFHLQRDYLGITGIGYRLVASTSIPVMIVNKARSAITARVPRSQPLRQGCTTYSPRAACVQLHWGSLQHSQDPLQQVGRKFAAPSQNPTPALGPAGLEFSALGLKEVVHPSPKATWPHSHSTRPRS